MDGSSPNTDQGQRDKKPYVPPEVKRVPLRPEEAVLGSCKNSVVSGPMGSNCAAVGPCALPGT
jgi:hypothetical protein